MEIQNPELQIRDMASALVKAEARVKALEAAFNDLTRELEIALEFLTPETITEFKCRAYPELYRRGACPGGRTMQPFALLTSLER